MSRLSTSAAILLLSACYPEERVAETAAGAVSGDLAAADARIAALEAEVAALRGLLGAVEAGSPVHDRLVALAEGQAANAAAIAAQGEAIAAQAEATGALAARLDAAEASLTANTSALAGHGVRLALVEEAAEGTATTVAAHGEAIDGLTEAVEELDGLATTFQSVGFSPEVTVRAGSWDRTSIKALFCSMEAQEIGAYGMPDHTHCVLEHDAETSTWTLATYATRGPLVRTCRMVCLGMLE